MPRRHRHATPAPPPAPTDVASLDSEWEKTHELLSGLLDISVDPRFHHEPRHPHASWLVLHITRVPNPQPQAKHTLPKQTKAVLGAVASLCATAERLRLRTAEHLAFWTGVLTSQMMADPLDASDVAIWWFANHVREREMRLKLEWSERKLEKGLLQPIQVFLDESWQAYDLVMTGDQSLRPRSMQIALCINRMHVTPKDMELLGDVFARRKEEDGQSTRLFQNAVASLEFQDTNLQTDALRALASRVYPRSRPIDGLRLESLFPPGPLGDANAARAPEYVASFKSVIMAAFDAKHCNDKARGVGLSLAYNRLHVVHLQAVFDALRSATRDLTSLSLKYALVAAPGDDAKRWEGPLKALEAIAFRTSNPSGHSGECELDLTGSLLLGSNVDVFFKSLEHRVARSLSLVQRALAKGMPVTCQVMDGVCMEHDDEDAANQELEVGVDYTVSAVTQADDSEKIFISYPGDGADEPDTTGFLVASDLVELAIDGKPLVRSRFHRLVLDGDVDNAVQGNVQNARSVCTCPTLELVDALGPRLTFLSVRRKRCWHRTRLSAIVRSCPNLCDLILEGSSSFVNDQIQWIEVLETLRDLRTLNLSSTRLNSVGTEDLVNALVQVSDLSLQRLALAQNQLTAQNVAQLQLLLDVVPTLELVELDSMGPSGDVEVYIRARRDLTRDYHGVVVATKPLSPPAKRAFLSVVNRLSGDHSGVESSVLASVFEMAQAVVSREILWRGSK